MKRLMSSLSVTRWLRVIAIAGVVVAAAASVDEAAAQDGVSITSSSAQSANSWCPRC